MAEITAKDILNFALVGHGTSGKTMLAEAMLFNNGAITRMGSIEEGSTVSDYHDDEIERNISINSSLLNFTHQDKKFNVLDTPGYTDFYGEVKGALRVADFAVVVVNGVNNIEVGTDQVWNSVSTYGIPHLIVVNMLDKEMANFDAVVDEARERFGTKVFPLGLPVNIGPGFNKIADVLRNELFTYDENGSGKAVKSSLEGDWVDKIGKLHGELIELVAESDDTLLEKFFEKDELTEDELRGGLHGAFMSHGLIPVFPISATTNIGVSRFMDVLAKYGPCAADFTQISGTKSTSDDTVITRDANADGLTVALVFKTMGEAHLGELSFFRVYAGSLKTGSDIRNTTRDRDERIGSIYSMNGNIRKEINAALAGDIAAVVKLKNTHTGDTLADKSEPIVLPGLALPEHKIRVAIVPRAKGDEDKLSTGLSTLHEEDPTFIYGYDPELKQTIISGQGELHLETAVKRLKQRFKVEVDMVQPRVPFRETVTQKGESKYRHKKQSGGAGQFAEVWMYVEPLPPGSGVQFESKLHGMAIDRVFIPSIEKGVMAAIEEGVLAGYHCVDLKAVVYDGKQHPVDSKDIAFQIAGRGAFKEAFMAAKPKLLEPIYQVEVSVPEEYMGDIMGDVSARRGKILGMETEGRLQKVKAQIPLANLDHYATALRSMTGGRGIHSQRFSSYDPMPLDVQRKVVAEYKATTESPAG